MRYRYLAISLLWVLSIVGCKKENVSIVDKQPVLTAAPKGFPEIPFTEENPYSLEKWKLGKQLFFDNIMSVDYTVNCASCHKPELAFSDNLSLSIGAGGLVGRSNAPSLVNVAYQPYFTRAGGVPTIEMQILVPIQEHDEFNFNIVKIAERMNKVPEYVEASRRAFDRDPDPYVITRALGVFERTIVSGNSAYDKFKSQGLPNAMSSDAKSGMNLFFSTKTNCSHCHSGFNFTNYNFENNGLYYEYSDNGRRRFTGKYADEALFKVPTLRNVALTAPYMHDGSLRTLEEVVEHYNKGGVAHRNRSDAVKPLGLSLIEKKQLIAFLESLTDNSLINNPNFYKDDL